MGEISKELGDIYFETGRLGDALLEYTEQLQACEELEDKLNCAIAHRMIGEVHASLGDYEEALTHQMLHLGIDMIVKHWPDIYNFCTGKMLTCLFR